MTTNEMVNCINDIFSQVATERKIRTYGEVMVAAYNLWAFLRFDANCEHPFFDPPKEGTFEF